MSLRTPHQVAFSNWYTSNLDRVGTLWREPVYGDRDVKLTLNRYYPCLTATIERDRCSVEVEWDLRTWDTLFAAEISVHRTDGFNYECVLRPTEDRELSPWIERIWEVHLYDPLVTWIEQKVLSCPMLHLCERHPLTWAKLQYQEAAPADVLVTLHGGDPMDEGCRCFISGCP